MPLKEYRGVASASRACSQHSLAPLKHKAFLAVVRAQKSSVGTPFPLQQLSDAVARVLPAGMSGLSRRALHFLRANLRVQAVAVWRGGDRLSALTGVGTEQR
jgi:hypothetical protein